MFNHYLIELGMATPHTLKIAAGKVFQITFEIIHNEQRCIRTPCKVSLIEFFPENS